MSYCEDYPQMSCVERLLKYVSQSLSWYTERQGDHEISKPDCRTARVPRGTDCTRAGDGIRRREGLSKGPVEPITAAPPGPWEEAGSNVRCKGTELSEADGRRGRGGGREEPSGDFRRASIPGG